MSFLSGLFGGSNPTLNKQIGTLGEIAGTSTQQGQGDISAASDFFHGLLSGNINSLAPQVNAMRKQGQQKIQSLSEFGNRSGGTNSAANTTADTTRAGINDFIQGLTGGAANSLAGLGTSLLSTGLSAYGQQAGVSQQQLQNWQQSIFGQGISSGLGYLEGFGLGKVK